MREENERLKEKEALADTMNITLPQSADEYDGEPEKFNSLDESDLFGDENAASTKEEKKEPEKKVTKPSRKEENAATKIQSQWKQYQAKKEYKALKKQRRKSIAKAEKEKALAKLKQMAAALKIQSTWRGYAARVQFAVVKQEAAAYKSKPKPKQEPSQPEVPSISVNKTSAPAIVTPTFVITEPQEERTLVTEERPPESDGKKEKAAMTIQSSYRGYRARKEFKVEQEKQRKEKELAAQKREQELEAQRRLQRELEEKQRKEQEENAATKIQATYRGYQTRKSVKDRKKKELLPQPSLEVHRAENVEAHGSNPLALRMQNFFTDEPSPTPVVKSVNPNQAVAATTIQATYRGYRTRKDISAQRALEQRSRESKYIVLSASQESERSDVEVSPKHQEIIIPAEQPKLKVTITRDDAATKIQSRYRGYRVRKQLKNSKSLEIMEQVEDQRGKSKAEEEKVSRDEAETKQPSDDELEEEIEGEVEVVNRTDERNKAATKIQSSYRGYVDRRKYKQMKYSQSAPVIQVHPPEIDLKIKHSAATKIQAIYRGYKARKERRALTKFAKLSASTEVAPPSSSRVRSARVPSDAMNVSLEYNKRDQAARLIQIHYRAYRRRKLVESTFRGNSEDLYFSEDEPISSITKSDYNPFKFKLDPVTSSSDDEF